MAKKKLCMYCMYYQSIGGGYGYCRLHNVYTTAYLQCDRFKPKKYR